MSFLLRLRSAGQFLAKVASLVMLAITIIKQHDELRDAIGTVISAARGV